MSRYTYVPNKVAGVSQGSIRNLKKEFALTLMSAWLTSSVHVIMGVLSSGDVSKQAPGFGLWYTRWLAEYGMSWETALTHNMRLSAFTGVRSVSGSEVSVRVYILTVQCVHKLSSPYGIGCFIVLRQRKHPLRVKTLFTYTPNSGWVTGCLN